MKVFSLLSLIRNLVNFTSTGIGNTLITLYGFCALRAFHTRCGVLFICAKAYQSLESDKRNAPHFFLSMMSTYGAK